MTSIFRRKGRKGWTLRYRDATGKPHTQRFDTKGEAQDELLELRVRPAPGRTVTLADYAPVWLRRRKPFLRPGPWINYELALRLHVLPRFGALPLGQIERGAVKDFLAAKLSDGFSPAHVALMRRSLRLCLEEALDERLLHTNPAAFPYRLGTGKNTNVRALTQAQLVSVLEAARVRVPESFVLLHLLAMTGMRLGEGLGLKWEDIDWTARTVRVCRGWTRSQVQPTKTGAERDVDLAGVILDDLRSWDAATKARALAAGRERPGWIFPAAKGRPVLHSRIATDFKLALRAAGVATHFSPHSLRHTYASLMLSAGESPYYVQRQLGHSTMTMTTGLYGRWLPAGNPAAADRLADLLAPGAAPQQSKAEQS